MHEGITVVLGYNGGRAVVGFSVSSYAENAGRLHAQVHYRSEREEFRCDLFADGLPDCTDRGPAAWDHKMQTSGRVAIGPDDLARPWEMTAFDQCTPEQCFTARSLVREALARLSGALKLASSDGASIETAATLGGTIPCGMLPKAKVVVADGTRGMRRGE